MEPVVEFLFRVYHTDTPPETIWPTEFLLGPHHPEIAIGKTLLRAAPYVKIWMPSGYCFHEHADLEHITTMQNDAFISLPAAKIFYGNCDNAANVHVYNRHLYTPYPVSYISHKGLFVAQFFEQECF